MLGGQGYLVQKVLNWPSLHAHELTQGGGAVSMIAPWWPSKLWATTPPDVGLPKPPTDAAQRVGRGQPAAGRGRATMVATRFRPA